MNFKDKWATDEAGNQFLFTIEMQRQLSEAGLPIEPESLADLPQTPPQKNRNQQPAERKETPRQEKKSFDEPAEIQIDPNSGKYIGRVKWYNKSKGYGFIARGGGEQIFFHKSNVDCELSELVDGAWVLYDVEETQKGFEAHDVEINQSA
ncbi:MAG: cold shock domain-containing protein [Ardenticatenaceae bacterium]|nr:cold shock domain-containing protein [Ardenticatenaceae bacterium]